MCCFEVGSVDLPDFLSSRLGMDGSPNLHSPFNHEHRKGYRQAASILGPTTRSTLNGAPKNGHRKLQNRGPINVQAAGSVDGPAPGAQNLLTSHKAHHSTTRVLFLFNIKSELARELCCSGFSTTSIGFAQGHNNTAPQLIQGLNSILPHA